MGQRYARTAAAWCSLLLAFPGPVVVPAAGHAPARAVGRFQQVTLAKGIAEMGEPMSMTVLPDRSVLHTSRDGTIRRTDAAGYTRVAAKLSVYAHDEEGLQGIAADPDFARNRQVYVYYAPPLSTPAGDAPATGRAADFAAWEGVNRLSRFTLTAANTLDTATETPILDVPSDRGICCHVGGDLDFDASGNLYLSTGDDTNPFRSDGYTPIDERADRNPAFDAQRTSGNTNDLRGKLLRIKVQPDGTYSIPPGNLFALGTPGTRPEIYAMGFRNPFRFTVDKATGIVYLGDHGPDAAAADPNRGPGGQVELNRITGPGNYGWPYCAGRNQPYRWYDFGSRKVGGRFDCDHPVNASRNNTGLVDLPPAMPAWLPYDEGSVPQFGTGSESPVGGPVYRYDPNLVSDVKFPKAYDGHFFPGEFGRRWIKDVTLRPDGTIRSIKPFPWSGTQVMDMAFGPDGALYVLDYGTGFGNGDARSALYRIDYVNGGRNPVAVASASPTSGGVPLRVRFSSARSVDPDGDRLTYAWDFDGDGTVDSTAANPTYTYTRAGTFTAQLTARDRHRLAGTASVTIVVGNTAPRVRLLAPANGQVFRFGEEVAFEVAASDPEDGPVECSRIRVEYILGHDSHGHLISSVNGCSGTIPTVSDGEHADGSNLFGVWTASYTDNGGLTGTDQHIAQPATRQAEHYTSQRGIQPFHHAGAYGGQTVGAVSSGDWIAFRPFVLRDVTEFVVRASSAGAGGTIELRVDSPTGPLAGSVKVPVTGGWETFREVAGPVAAPAGTHTMYLRFKGGKGALFDVDEFTLVRGGGP